jgi:hypothetical protein
MTDDILRIPANPQREYPGFWKKVLEAGGDDLLHAHIDGMIWPRRGPSILAEEGALFLCIQHGITSDRQLRKQPDNIRNKLPAHPPRTYSANFWKRVQAELNIKPKKWRSRSMAVMACADLGITSLHILTQKRTSAYFKKRYRTIPSHPERIYGADFFAAVREHIQLFKKVRP